jgi:type I restriction enzyme, S subunit
VMSAIFSKGGKDSMPTLPQGWTWATINDFVDIILGQSPPSSTYNNYGNGLPFFQGKLEFGDLHPNTQKWCSHPKKIANAGDVLLSIRAPVGATNIATERCCIGRGLAALHPVAGVNSFFVFYSIRAFERKIAEQSTGSTFDAITGERLKKIEFPVPPLPEQHRLITKLEELITQLDAGVASLKKVQAQLKLYRQAVMKAAIEGRLTQEWREAHKGKFETAEELIKKIRKFDEKASKPRITNIADLNIKELPHLPSGWVYAKIDDIANIGTGATPSRTISKYWNNGTIPWVTSSAVNWLFVKYTEEKITEIALKETRVKIFPVHT